MNIKLAYGRDGLDVELPDFCDVIEPIFEEGKKDQIGEVVRSLKNPIGTPPLRDIVKSTDSVGIVFSDITRATPYDVILPAIFSELSHVPAGNFTLFNATGTHRENTDDEIIRILGKEFAEKYRIVQNNCEDIESHRYIGTTREGNRIEILSEFLDCDVRILTGFIEPHFFAGFSGGGKAVMPGLATLGTVQRNHNAVHMDHRNSIWGITEGNLLWEEVKEAAGFAKPSFLVNVSLNRNQEVIRSFGGDYVEAHREGCRYVREHAMAGVEKPYDIVITSNSGYPLDLNMYQAVKGMSAASLIVKEGGDIIICADCWDGIPSHGKYGQLLEDYDTPDEVLSKIRSPGYFMQDQWQVQIHALICRKADVHFYSDNLTDEQIVTGYMTPCRNIPETVRKIIEKKGPGLSICVMPEGPQTIPYIK